MSNKDDCISRRAAVDVVDFECGEWMGLAKTIINKLEALPAVQPEQVCVATVTLTDEQVKEAVEKAKNAVISVIEPEPHWIPVTERLPESKEEDLEYPTVIVCFADGDVTTACYYESTKEWGRGDMYNYVCYPIAWMPMPIPPYYGGYGE